MCKVRELLFKLRKANALAGMQVLNAGYPTLNTTYRGQAETTDGEVFQGFIKDVTCRQLFNEVFAFALAKHLGLPVAETMLCEVSPSVQKLATGAEYASYPSGSRIALLSVDTLAVSLMPQVSDPELKDLDPGLVNHLCNWSRLGELYAFDTWIANIDRNPGNILLDQKGDYHLIDHGSSFTGEKWKPTSFVPDHSYPCRLQEWLSPKLKPANRTHASSAIGDFDQKLENIATNDIYTALEIDLLQDSDLECSLLQFLDARIEYVNSLAHNSMFAKPVS